MSRVILTDGSTAEIRRLRPDDRAAVEDLFAACSDENLYTRFFTLGRGVVVRHLDHLFTGAEDTITYVAIRAARIIGIADVEQCDEISSEIAFLVADDAHGLGVATLLLERAAADARAAGIDWFNADVLAVNHPMLEVFADAGYTVERHPDHADVVLRMSTELSPAARRAMHARHAASLARASEVGTLVPEFRASRP